MTIGGPDTDGTDRVGACRAGARHRVGTATRLSQQGLSQAKLLPALRGALSRLRDLLFEAPTDALGRINLWCTRICIVALVAMWAIYLETL